MADLPPIDPARRRTVDAAREAWIRRLVDTSRRNNLLYFRDLKVGTLDLFHAEAGSVDELLWGAKVPLAHLVPESADPKAPTKLKEIVRKALSNLEEKGLETLYVAYGMATWPAEDDGRPPEAAVALLPVTVEGKRNESLVLVPSGPPRANLALLHALEEMGAPFEEEEGEDAVAMLDRMRATVDVKGFDIRPRAVLGNFSFQKLAMVQDLRDQGEALVRNDLIAALAGDLEARGAVAARRVATDPREFDALPPGEEFMPLDADSSQQAVVHAIAKGSDGVIQGPPGCGKSQTIANAIATLVAQGQRVLFVAEKRAALEAVHKRLQARGLGHLALDLHGATVSQKAVVTRIAEALAAVRTAIDPDEVEPHSRFADRRERLVRHDRLMHSPVLPSGLTPYALQAALIDAAGTPAKTRWRGPELVRLTPEVATQVQDLLEEAAGHADLFMRRGLSPWKEANLKDGHAAQAVLDAAKEYQSRLVELRRRYAEFEKQNGIEIPFVLAELQKCLTVFVDVNRFLEKYDEAIFSEWGSLLNALAPAEALPLRRLSALLFDREYRQARRRLHELARDGRADAGEVLKNRHLPQMWEELPLSLDDPTPREVRIDPDLKNALYEALEALKPVNAAWPKSFDLEKSHEPIHLTESLLADEASARAIPRVRAIELSLTNLWVGALMEEIKASGCDPSTWKHLFRNAWLHSCYDAARAELADLAGFSGVSHGEFAAQFRELDRQRVRLAADRVRRAHAEAAINTMNAWPEQADRVRSETQKRTRHLPLRRLLEEAPDVLPAICPCWMASPLNVSQLLSAERRFFDVVIFDEASQVLPEDAVCAVLRGERLVVAGDRHQLPPTTFFADGADDEEEESAMTGFQSLLDQVGAFLEPWPLLWHYRSRDERLIAFSNRHIYGDGLVTFPGVGGAPCVSHVLVEGRSGDEESSVAEVERVVELVLAHAAEHPNRSLGVIAMGLKHANRIQAALDRALDARPELESFFAVETAERFFVKNLEQVQGDERDAIIISVGYGKDANGKLPYRFGPLLYDGGERRLNVAVSRARRQMTVVSSFSHRDMDPARSTKRGVELLRAFLEFAASEGASLADRTSSVARTDAFERDVLEALRARGLPLVAKHGVSALKIDLAAAHPTDPGKFVLAVETDGPTYHAAPTARDRDRLRQQQLEEVGWCYHRIWSPDWMLHREREIETAFRAWEEATVGEISLPPTLPEEPTPVSTVRERGEPPTVARQGDIDLVAPEDLDRLVIWAQSDGGLRTDDELIDEVADLLGYARKGAKIVRTIHAAIDRTRA